MLLRKPSFHKVVEKVRSMARKLACKGYRVKNSKVGGRAREIRGVKAGGQKKD